MAKAHTRPRPRLCAWIPARLHFAHELLHAAGCHLQITELHLRVRKLDLTKLQRGQVHRGPVLPQEPGKNGLGVDVPVLGRQAGGQTNLEPHCGLVLLAAPPPGLEERLFDGCQHSLWRELFVANRTAVTHSSVEQVLRQAVGVGDEVASRAHRLHGTISTHEANVVRGPSGGHGEGRRGKAMRMLEQLRRHRPDAPVTKKRMPTHKARHAAWPTLLN